MQNKISEKNVHLKISVRKENERSKLNVKDEIFMRENNSGIFENWKKN